MQRILNIKILAVCEYYIMDDNDTANNLKYDI